METICPIGLQFSGTVEGANRIVVLKFQSILTTLRINVKTKNSVKTTPYVSYDLVRIRFN